MMGSLAFKGQAGQQEEDPENSAASSAANMKQNKGSENDMNL